MLENKRVKRESLLAKMCREQFVESSKVVGKYSISNLEAREVQDC